MVGHDEHRVVGGGRAQVAHHEVTVKLNKKQEAKRRNEYLSKGKERKGKERKGKEKKGDVPHARHMLCSV